MGSSDQDRREEIERLRKAGRVEVQGDLDRANTEFEEFISLAAHNLRESLRDVASFSELLAETCAGRLNADSRAYLERIQDGAAAMQSLLADVVDYWAGRAGQRQASPTDMEAALGQALLRAEKQISERSAVITHDTLPEVRGDFEVLTKVLHHLIRNGIEYCETPSPRVHISAMRPDSDWVFSVKDNGPGIDPAFQTRIFEVFKRLHGKEHPGNGLGLAFCRKAIEGLGGRMWMESTPGEGSTFYFTLPPVDSIG